MKPEELRARGVALSGRVRRQVDTTQRFQLLVKARQTSRRLGYALVAATVVAVLVGVSFLLTISDAPVVTQPPPPTTLDAGLQPLPVEVWVVILDSYTVDADTGTCTGSGEVSGVIEGSLVFFVDEASGVQLSSVSLPAGSAVLQGDAPLFLFPSGHEAGCVFELGELAVTGFDVRFESDPNIGISSNSSGQRLVVRLEG